VGSDWTALATPRKRGKRKKKKQRERERESIADRKEAENVGRWRRRRLEHHFEYIVEAVRIVSPEGTRQLNVGCSRH